MSDEEFAHRYRVMQKYVGWTDDDARRVAALGPMVAPHSRALIEDFYAEIQRHPEAACVITGGTEQIERLSQTLREWLAQLLGGNYDEAYMARRWKVGYRHVEIGLPQRYTSLALSRLRDGIARHVWSAWQDTDDELVASLASLNKLLDLDHALIQDAYEFEHVRRERLLERERSERNFRHLVESASCLIIILNSQFECIYFNPHAEATTGCTAGEISDDPTRVLAFLGSGDVAAIRLREVLSSGQPATYEAQVARPSGSASWVTWTLSRMTDFEGGLALLAVGHDVTEQKRSAAQLLQASRLATIGEMYARLAHESRNALQRLRVCTDMLTDQLTDRPSAVAILDRSQRAQDDLRRLLDEVRNFAAPMTLERTECRLPALWKEAWNLLQAPYKDRDAKLVDVDWDVDASFRIGVDRFRMVQAFRNVFENSLAACGDTAIIRIRGQEITVDGQMHVEIVIDDNGPGFAVEAIHRAFEPFYTTKSAGTGLGLAIVRRIVEAHAGTISAHVGPSGGAQIRVVLPLAPIPPT